MENLFKKLGLSKNVLKSIEKLGYTTPSEIQSLLIPVILDGKDVFGQAKTGTGKTLAFAASVLSNINREKTGVKAIILSPTRELALQISKEFKDLDRDREFNITAVYGGSDIKKQINILNSGPDIVIGTPGRVKDLIKRKKLNLTVIDYFVLDEADEMLNMGFIKDIEEIFTKTARDKQVLMLSATMSRQVKVLVENYLRKDYKHIQVESDTKTADNIKQGFHVVNTKDKPEILSRIIDARTIKKAIVFVKTKSDCDSLTEELLNRGYLADVIHGDIPQGQRIRTLDKFKRNEFKILIATDVAARGIHINNIELVVNYHLPFDKEAYVHRIGRTGRADNHGEAISLITQKEKDMINRISKYINHPIVPLDVPQKEEIMKVKYDEVMKNAKDLIAENNMDTELEFVRDLNKTDLVKLSAALLKYSVTKEIGSDLQKEIVVKERSVRTVDDGTKRTFINIGKKDRIRKTEFLEFIEEITSLKKDKFSNIEILENFSFIDVDETVVEDFIKLISGNEYNGRKINAEISTKKSTKRPRDNKFDGRSRNNRSFDRKSGDNKRFDRKSGDNKRFDRKSSDNKKFDRKRNFK